MRIKVLNELWSAPKRNGAQLGLQWCRYPFEGGAHCGYCFIWRSQRGLHPDRGQAYIPKRGVMLELMQKASKAGWFGVVEHQGS